MDTAVGRNTNVGNFSSAYYLLEGLSEIGIEYLFCNLGTDHAPIIEEMAHRRKRGERPAKSARSDEGSTRYYLDYLDPNTAALLQRIARLTGAALHTIVSVGFQTVKCVRCKWQIHNMSTGETRDRHTPRARFAS